MLAVAPLIEGVTALAISKGLSAQIDKIVKSELSCGGAVEKVKEVGKDSAAFNDLRRYLGYGSRVEKTLETTILAYVSMLLSGYEQHGIFSLSGMYLVVAIALAINLVVFLLKIASRSINGFGRWAGLGHCAIAIILSLSLVCLNIGYSRLHTSSTPSPSPGASPSSSKTAIGQGP